MLNRQNGQYIIITARIPKKKNDHILFEMKKRKCKEKNVDVGEEKVKLVIFSLLEDYYAIDGAYIKDILPVGKITFVPGSSDYILGIINMRGDIESVLDINKIMGLPERQTDKNSRIAIAEKEGIRSGILVDSVLDVIDVHKSSIKTPVATPSKSLQEFVVGYTTYNNKSAYLIDVGRIFGKISG